MSTILIIKLHQQYMKPIFRLPNAVKTTLLLLFLTNISINSALSQVSSEAISEGMVKQIAVKPTHGTYVSGTSNLVDRNYASSKFLVISDDEQAYLQFELNAIQGNIEDAALEIYVSRVTRGGGEVNIYHLLNDEWNANSVTWNAKPVGAETLVGTVDAVANDQYIILPIGDLVNQVREGDQTLSLVLKKGQSADPGARIALKSTQDEDISLHPKLYVDTLDKVIPQDITLNDDNGLSAERDVLSDVVARNSRNSGGEPNSSGARGGEPNSSGARGGEPSSSGARGGEPSSSGARGGEPSSSGARGGEPSSSGARGGTNSGSGTSVPELTPGGEAREHTFTRASDLAVTLPEGDADTTGAIPASSYVDSNGNFVYQLPIYVQPGINGMTPSVSLIYNSGSTKEGVLGYGWTLNAGVSTISRRLPSYLVDGDDYAEKNILDIFDVTNNTYSFNGMPLRYVSDYTMFATDNDMHVRIRRFAPNGPTNVSANPTSNSRGDYWKIESNAITEELKTRLVGQKRATNGVIALNWLTSTKVDKFNNYINYTYKYDSAGDFIGIENIYYAGSPGDYDSRIKFEYKPNDADHVTQKYHQGQLIQSNKELLSDIIVYLNGQETHRYSISYPPNGYADDIGKAYIDKITIKKKTGGSSYVVLDEHVFSAVPPTADNSYTDLGFEETTDYSNIPIPLSGMEYKRYSNSPNVIPGKIRDSSSHWGTLGVQMFDFDLDGDLDAYYSIIYRRREHDFGRISKLYENTGTDFVDVSESKANCLLPTHIMKVHYWEYLHKQKAYPSIEDSWLNLTFVDINGDGIGDAVSNEGTVYINQGYGSANHVKANALWVEDANYAIPSLGKNFVQKLYPDNQDKRIVSLFNDFDGDGLVDVYRAQFMPTVLGKALRFNVWVNTGSGWEVKYSSPRIPATYQDPNNPLLEKAYKHFYLNWYLTLSEKERKTNPIFPQLYNMFDSGSSNVVNTSIKTSGTGFPVDMDRNGTIDFIHDYVSTKDFIEGLDLGVNSQNLSNQHGTYIHEVDPNELATALVDAARSSGAPPGSEPFIDIFFGGKPPTGTIGTVDKDEVESLISKYAEFSGAIFMNNGKGFESLKRDNGDIVKIKNPIMRYNSTKSVTAYIKSTQIVDVNGDNYPDLVYNDASDTSNKSVQVFTGRDLVDRQQLIPSYEAVASNNGVDLGVRYLDLNGDLLLDYLQCFERKNNNHASIPSHYALNQQGQEMGGLSSDAYIVKPLSVDVEISRAEKARQLLCGVPASFNPADPTNIAIGRLMASLPEDLVPYVDAFMIADMVYEIGKFMNTSQTISAGSGQRLFDINGDGGVDSVYVPGKIDFFANFRIDLKTETSDIKIQLNKRSGDFLKLKTFRSNFSDITVEYDKLTDDATVISRSTGKPGKADESIMPMTTPLQVVSSVTHEIAGKDYAINYSYEEPLSYGEAGSAFGKMWSYSDIDRTANLSVNQVLTPDSATFGLTQTSSVFKYKPDTSILEPHLLKEYTKYLNLHNFTANNFGVWQPYSTGYFDDDNRPILESAPSTRTYLEEPYFVVTSTQLRRADPASQAIYFYDTTTPIPSRFGGAYKLTHSIVTESPKNNNVSKNNTNFETSTGIAYKEYSESEFTSYTGSEWIVDRIDSVQSWLASGRHDGTNTSTDSSALDFRPTKTTFEYDPSHRWKHISTTHGLDSLGNNRIKTSYDYDDYGNITTVARSALAQSDPVRATQTVYATDGHFEGRAVRYKKIGVDDASMEDTGWRTDYSNYDLMYMVPQTVTFNAGTTASPNNQVTRFEFDIYGRAKKVTAPDGKISLTNFVKEGDSSSKVAYSKHQIISGNYYTKTLYDNVGRVVERIFPGPDWDGTVPSDGFNNQWSKIITSYNDNGTLNFVSRSLPWASSSSSGVGRGRITNVNTGGGRVTSSSSSSSSNRRSRLGRTSVTNDSSSSSSSSSSGRTSSGGSGSGRGTTSTIERSKMSVENRYDSYDRLRESYHRGELVAEYSYDKNAVTVTDALGVETTTVSYGPAGRLTISPPNQDAITGAVLELYGVDGQTKAIRTMVPYDRNARSNTLQVDSTILMEYNEFGHRTGLNDPSFGNISYVSNAYGEITRIDKNADEPADATRIIYERDLHGRSSKITYDGNRREWNEATKEFVSKKQPRRIERYQFDSQGNNVFNGFVFSETLFEGGSTKYQASHKPDSYGRRLSTTTAIIDEEAHAFSDSVVYDKLGRVITKNFPHKNTDEQYSVDYFYTNDMRLDEIRDQDRTHILWKNVDTDRDGFLNAEQLGNNTMVKHDPNSRGLLKQTVAFNSSQEEIMKASYQYFDDMNMRSRFFDLKENNNVTTTETFGYDNLKQLTSVMHTYTGNDIDKDLQLSYKYDGHSRMLKKDRIVEKGGVADIETLHFTYPSSDLDDSATSTK